MRITITEAEKKVFLAKWKQPDTLEGFEMWLLHRANRPEEFTDASECQRAWNVLKTFQLRHLAQPPIEIKLPVLGKGWTEGVSGT